jgi:hypothetical protein
MELVRDRGFLGRSVPWNSLHVARVYKLGRHHVDATPPICADPRLFCAIGSDGAYHSFGTTAKSKKRRTITIELKIFGARDYFSLRSRRALNAHTSLLRVQVGRCQQENVIHGNHGMARDGCNPRCCTRANGKGADHQGARATCRVALVLASILRLIANRFITK